MYKIEETNYGLKLTFEDFIHRQEMEDWLKESERVLQNKNNEFVVFIDIRNLVPFEEDTHEVVFNGHKMYVEKGMKRLVVVLTSFLVKEQFVRIAKKSGTYKLMRFIDVSMTPDWEDKAYAWILEGIEP